MAQPHVLVVLQNKGMTNASLELATSVICELETVATKEAGEDVNTLSEVDGTSIQFDTLAELMCNQHLPTLVHPSTADQIRRVQKVVISKGVMGLFKRGSQYEDGYQSLGTVTRTIISVLDENVANTEHCPRVLATLSIVGNARCSQHSHPGQK
jgi:hypothetical protein